MLFKTTVSRWGGIGRSSHIINKNTGTPYVFSITNVSKLKAEGAGSVFEYLTSPVFRRTGFDEIHCDTAYLTVKQEFDIDPTLTTLELSVYPDNNLSKTPYTTYVNMLDFAYAWAHHPYPANSWLVYNQRGAGAKRILVAMTLDELVALDNQFGPDNVQWYEFVDPLEEIHPTWYIRV